MLATNKNASLKKEKKKPPYPKNNPFGEENKLNI
jgi:hypothetical protein